MSLRDKAAQLVFLPYYGDVPNVRSEDYRRYFGWVRNLRIGGLVLINRTENGRLRYSEAYAMATFLNRMQRASKVPLLVAGDFERGDSMRVESKTLFPHAMAFSATGDPALSRVEGEITARQAHALGVPWILAPVADVNNNPDNPIINIRSYGEKPEDVAAHVQAFIRGAHEQGDVLVTAKHFPGHGDTAVDSHIALPLNTASRERLSAVEFPPFRAAIVAGVDSIMSAHIAVPALDDTKVPATLSAPVLTGVLRRELGFRGLISTDAMDMQGLTKQWSPGQAAARAIEAGVDVLMIPTDAEAAIKGVVGAVQRGEISRARLDESVARVLGAKVRAGLAKRRTADLDEMMDALDRPEDIAKAQEIADRAVTLVRNSGNVVPLAAAQNPCFVVLTESRGSTQGRAFASEVRRRVPNARLITLDPAASEADLAQAAAASASCDRTVFAAFVSVAAYRGSVALPGGFPQLVDTVAAAGKPVVLVALGNPYLLRNFPGVAGYMTTYSTVRPSETAAVKALFGEIAIRGRLPVTIPGVAEYGAGIQLPATAPAARP